jgi:cytochrome P450
MNLSIALHSLWFIFFSSFLFYLYNKKHQSKKKPTIYGLKSYPIIGYLPHFVRNSHRFLDWITEILLQSPTCTMGFRSIGSTYGIITANPANLEHMLKTNPSNYPKGQRIISTMKDFLGHGIFNSDDDDWKWQRKTASFEFNKRSLRNFVVETVHFEIVNRLLPILNRAVEKGARVELQDVLEKFAFDNICKVVIGEDPACLTEEGEFGEAGSSKEFMTAFSDAQVHMFILKVKKKKKKKVKESALV